MNTACTISFVQNYFPHYPVFCVEVEDVFVVKYMTFLWSVWVGAHFTSVIHYRKACGCIFLFAKLLMQNAQKGFPSNGCVCQNFYLTFKDLRNIYILLEKAGIPCKNLSLLSHSSEHVFCKTTNFCLDFLTTCHCMVQQARLFKVQCNGHHLQVLICILSEVFQLHYNMS